MPLQHNTLTASDLSPRRDGEDAADVPYMVMQNFGPNKAKLDLHLLGEEMVEQGLKVTRCLIFSPDGVRVRSAPIQTAVLLVNIARTPVCTDHVFAL